VREGLKIIVRIREGVRGANWKHSGSKEDYLSDLTLKDPCKIPERSLEGGAYS